MNIFNVPPTTQTPDNVKKTREFGTDALRNEMYLFANSNYNEMRRHEKFLKNGQKVASTQELPLWEGNIRMHFEMVYEEPQSTKPGRPKKPK